MTFSQQQSTRTMRQYKKKYHIVTRYKDQDYEHRSPDPEFKPNTTFWPWDKTKLSDYGPDARERMRKLRACPGCNGLGKVFHHGYLYFCDDCDGTGSRMPNLAAKAPVIRMNKLQ